LSDKVEPERKGKFEAIEILIMTDKSVTFMDIGMTSEEPLDAMSLQNTFATITRSVSGQVISLHHHFFAARIASERKIFKFLQQEVFLCHRFETWITCLFRKQTRKKKLSPRMGKEASDLNNDFNQFRVDIENALKKTKQKFCRKSIRC